MKLVDLNGLAPMAGVTAAMGEELNGQTHPTGPTAGVTSDIGDALSAGGYSGNTSSCDNEGVAWDEVGNYFEKTLNQLIYGNFTDDITALGVIVEVGLGIFELDFPMDVRDLLADIYLCEEGEQSGWWILLDIIALIPIIGALKYSDEVETLVKRVEWKKIWKDISDSCPSDVKKISDNFKELWEKGSKKISGLGDDIKTWWKKGDELVEGAGETGKKAVNAAENSSLNALTGVMEGGQEAAEHTQANDLWSLADELKEDQKAAESNGAVLTEVLEGDTAAVDDVVTNNANITDDVIESGLNSNLLDELANSGVKYNPEDIVAITKTADGKLVWLENGTDTAGLNHIITEHADDFLNKGITQEQIPDYVMNALENGKIVGYQGRGTGRPIYEFTYNGEIHKVAITVGNNGCIVGANPK